MLSKREVENNIAELRSINEKRLGKYYRNYRRYNSTPFSSIKNIKNPDVVGYYNFNDIDMYEDTGLTPQFNVIKSCIDTLTSKISQSKVRPFFNAVDGSSFKDIKTIKATQQFFDHLYDMQGVTRIMSDVFRDSCIFDTGHIFVDPFEKKIKRVLPYQVFVRPSELTYGKLTRIYLEFTDYPVTLLDEEIKKKIKKKRVNNEYCTHGMYFDIENDTFCRYIDILGTYDCVSWTSDSIPLVSITYCNPVIGNTSQSVVDMLNSIQLQIDEIASKIKTASELNPALTYFVPNNSDVNVQKLDNGIGNIVTYTPTPSMTGSPVTVATPSFIDPQYLETLNMYMQNAYEMVGISLLSAQSKKPAGLDSGVALSTMEDMESDRFETQLSQIIRGYVELAKVCINVFPKDEDVLPKDDHRISIKWKDVVEQSDRMTIQYSGADFLSKDPSTKLQQLQALAQAGVIPQSRVSQLLEIPDIDTGYSLSNNAINAVLVVIEDCVEHDKFDVPDYIPFTMLKEEIINTQLSLRSTNNEKNIKDIKKLDKLYDNVEQKEKQWSTAMNESMAQEQAQEGELNTGTNVLTEEANMEKINQPNPDLDMQSQLELGW